MNRFFSPEYSETSVPRRLYARLDQTEPVNPAESEKAMFAYDAVDADWLGFRTGMPFDLDAPEQIFDGQRGWWYLRRQDRFVGNDPFDDVPLYRLEITLQRDSLYDDLLEFADEWLEFELDPTGGTEVDIYNGLFSPPVPAFLADRPRRSRKSKALDAAFDMDAFPDATQIEIERAMSGAQSYDRLAIYDIGQGSASAVLDAQDGIALYFDLGCGVYRNAHTCPLQQLVFCHCGAPVILSHWDADHWAAAAKDPAMLQLTWIAPRQQIGPKHKVFAASIVRNGTLLIVPNVAPNYTASSRRGEALTLSRATGPLSDRNSSGLVAIVEDSNACRAWLLTGDAGYSHIRGIRNRDFVAIVVPHHGADMGAANTPPAQSMTQSYSRAVYSFGPGNRHGRTAVQHPTTPAVKAHGNAGWNHGSWSVANPGTSVAGGDVLATAQHSSAHLDGAVCAWTSLPAVPVPACATCNATTVVNQG